MSEKIFVSIGVTKKTYNFNNLYSYLDVGMTNQSKDEFKKFLDENIGKNLVLSVHELCEMKIKKKVNLNITFGQVTNAYHTSDYEVVGNNIDFSRSSTRKKFTKKDGSMRITKDFCEKNDVGWSSYNFNFCGRTWYVHPFFEKYKIDTIGDAGLIVLLVEAE